jgi:hypothetical protein
MTKTLAGLQVTSEKIDLVVLILSNEQFTLEGQYTLKLQAGDRPPAYGKIYNDVVDLITDKKIDCACVKASATMGSGTSGGLLNGAELRGVAIAACASVCDVKLVRKGVVSRAYGERKVDQYIADNSFWETRGLASLQKGKREAAFLVISQFTK